MWADPPWREGLSPTEREMRAWVRRVEKLRYQLRLVVGDE